MHQEPLPFIDIVHELQTPIAVILGNLELVESGNASERKRAMRVIRGTLSGMTCMVNDVLGNFRSEIRSNNAADEIIDVPALTEEIKEDCIILAINRNISLAVKNKNIGHEESISVFGDKYKLKEVILNLISNALRHTDPGGSIFLKSEVAFNGKERVIIISVEDTGAGIPAEHAEHIFERFYRIAGNDGQGSGLGLSICRAIIEEYGGTITLKSELGKGSCFLISLPAA